MTFLPVNKENSHLCNITPLQINHTMCMGSCTYIYMHIVAYTWLKIVAYTSYKTDTKKQRCIPKNEIKTQNLEESE